MFPSYGFSDGKFRFGVSAPLTGILAEYGAAIKNGLILAKDDRKDEFATIDLFLEDSQWDPKTAVSVFNALHRVKHAQLIYSWGNPPNDAVAPVAESLQVPTLAMSSNHEITRNRQFIVRTIPSGEELGILLSNYLSKTGQKRYGIALAEVSYLQGLYAGFKADSERKGSTVELLGTFDPGAQDFRSAISAARRRNYDLLGVLLITGQVQSFYRQLNDQKINIPTFGADFHGSQTEIAASGPAIDGAVFPDLKVAPEFRSRYKAKFGNDIQIAFAANAYDVALLVAKLFGNGTSSSLTNQEILAALRGNTIISGAHSHFSYSNDNQHGPAYKTPLVIRRIEGAGIIDYPDSQ
jgi:branched-chain amino acid transport system substrate-binding protein